MDIELSPKIVSTMTCIVETNLKFDLDVIFEYLNISSIVKGLKYKNKSRGYVKNNKCFGNQVTIIIELNDKLINVKVFYTKFQVTGVKHQDKALEACQILIDLFKKINIYRRINVIIENNLILDKKRNDVLRFSKVKDTIDMYKKIGKIINSDTYEITEIPEIPETPEILDDSHIKVKRDDYFPSVFKSIQSENFVYRLYNDLFEDIGYVEYKFDKIRKKIALINLILEKTEDPFVYNVKDKYGNSKGIYKYTFNEGLEISKCCCIEQIKDSVVLYNKAISSSVHYKHIELNVDIINCNSSFSIKTKTKSSLIMIRLSEFLMDYYYENKEVSIIYDPNRYVAIKVIYYKKKYDGSYMKLCMCIFRSGIINIMGSRSIENDNFLYKEVKNWFKEKSMLDSIIFENQTKGQGQGKIQIKENLTIFDLI